MKIKFRKGETASNAVVKIANEEEKDKEVNVQNSPKLSSGNTHEETKYAVVPHCTLTGMHSPVIMEYSDIISRVPLPYAIKNKVSEKPEIYCYGFFKIDGETYTSNELDVVSDSNNRKFIRIKKSGVIHEIKKASIVEPIDANDNVPLSNVMYVNSGRLKLGQGATKPNIVGLDGSSKVMSLKSAKIRMTFKDDAVMYIIYDNNALSEAQIGNSIPYHILETGLTDEIEYTFGEDFDKEVSNPMLTRLASMLAGQTFKIAPAFRATLNTYVKQMKDGNISISSLSSLSSILELEFSVFPSVGIDKIYGNFIDVKIPNRNKSNASTYDNFDVNDIDALITGVRVPKGVYNLSDIRSRIASNTLTIGDIQTIIENAIER